MVCEFIFFRIKNISIIERFNKVKLFNIVISLIILEFLVVGCFMIKKMLVVCKYRIYKLKCNIFFKK